ncbi:CopG family transcriptional regulator [Salmonella enterica]|nr:CopG family transcriptional regulator [Salmonella enterica]
MTGNGAPKKEGRRPRREVPPIKVWVTDDEKAEIADRAAQAGLSLSAYLLAAGLHHPIRSRVDLTAVGDLAKVNGDLGRVAGLLKLWLAEKRGQGARPIDVEAMMKDFRALQAEMLALMSQVVR